MEWLPRMTAPLRFLGSVATLVSIARISRRAQRHTVYNHLLAAISIFDMMFSLHYILGRAAMPRDAGLQNARGTWGTCAFQNALSQLGIAEFYYAIYWSFATTSANPR